MWNGLTITGSTIQYTDRYHVASEAPSARWKTDTGVSR